MIRLIPSFSIIVSFFLFFSPIHAADYYWIGGSGNWGDISHWATTSGGIITHSQAPTADDDVYFDANSFAGPGQTVTFGAGVVFFRNMTWQGVTNMPTLTGENTATINAYGSIELNADMNFDFDGQFVFTGPTADNRLNFGPHKIGQNVLFSGTGGWILDGDAIVDSLIIFNEGTLNTNGQLVECQYFDSRTISPRTLQLGASTIRITGRSLGQPATIGSPLILQPLRLNATNLVMDPGTSVIELTNPIVDLWMEGPGTINFNRVVLTSPTGNSRILPWHVSADESTFPVMNYAELELFHLTLLNGSPIIGNLILHQDQRYSFEGGQTFNLGNIDAAGDCLAGITLSSTDDANAAIFSSTNNITIDFVSLRAIRTQGTGVFTANNAVDLGNNDGWIINPRASQSFFWVGGTGDWNDPAHWSFSSGGPSSGCIPTAIDDVFFDMNSFNASGQSVNINVENAYCHNMDWTDATNNPALTGPVQNAIRLSGSLTFIAAMQHTFEGNYYFESSQSGNTLQSAGQSFNFDLFFEGTNGEWILLDETKVLRSIFFLSGTLRTNDQRVSCNGFESIEPFQRTLILGNSYILIGDQNLGPVNWRIRADNLIFDAGTSTIESAGPAFNTFRTEGDGNMIYNNLIFSAFNVSFQSAMNNSSPIVNVDSLLYLRDGSIAGNNIVNYWHFEAGHQYNFTSDRTQTITELDANGDCNNGFVYIRTSTLGYTTNFDIGPNHTLERLYLHGIHQIGSGQLTANNSFDGGENSGWTFSTSSGRTLYWVGDAGDWNDENNWSLASGGPGGECIPTPLDNVIFDENSFATASARVEIPVRNDAYCLDMNWTGGVTELPVLALRRLNIFGSLQLDATVVWDGTATYFSGEGDHTIHTNNNTLYSIFFEGSGTYTLLDGLNSDFIRHIRGTFNTNSQPIVALNYAANSIPNPKGLILGDSHIQLTGSNLTISFLTFSIFSDGMVIEPGNSTIEFLHPDAGLRMDYPLDLHNVIFSDAQSDALVDTEGAVFNTLQFFGDGQIQGTIETDTLLCAPGKIYVFESNHTQTIKEYWRIIGTNCTPIELSSSSIGSLADVNMPPNASILADFIQMRDIQGLGGASFIAGARSTNIANSNVGWIFEAAPEFVDVGFLGPDRALCQGEPVTLDAYNYTLGETYLWQDGSIDTTILADQSGMYSVEVTFTNNCVIQDTINIIAAQDFQVDIQDDPTLCEGDLLGTRCRYRHHECNLSME